MNASRLRLLLERLLNAESESGIAGHLTELVNSYLQVSNSTNASTREAARVAFENFVTSASALSQRLSDDVGIEAVNTFMVSSVTLGFSEEISSFIAQSSGSPSTVASRLTSIKAEREKIFTRLSIANSELHRIGIEVDEPALGSTELGFLIPRVLFANRLDEFAVQLKNISLLVDAFSIVATGARQEATIDTINTSNPLLFLNIDPETTSQIVDAVKFAIDVAKDVSALKAGFDVLKSLFGPGEVKKVEDGIEEKIEARVSEEVSRQMEEFKKSHSPEDAREPEIALRRSLRFLIDQIEGGMQIKVRAGLGGELSKEQTARLGELLKKAEKLSFPSPQEAPAALLTDQRTDPTDPTEPPNE